MTKYILCLGDGMADHPIAELGNKTPLEFAFTPNMDRIAQNGQSGMVHTVPDGYSPGSDVANMGILGYDPREFYTGRGPIEAASMGIKVPDEKIVFRCNLVCIENGIMKDFTSGHISTEEADSLMKELDTHFNDLDFFSGVSYRHIVLMKKSFLNLKTVAPHDITDQKVDKFFPKGENEIEMMAIIDEAHRILMSYDVNKKRAENGQSMATHIWLWSQGPLPKYSSFKSKYGIDGGIVTAVDLLKGLATLSGLKSPDVEGATGFIDTNYKGKVDAGLALLESSDFSYIHIEAPDEAGHMGDYKLKIKAIEDFDAKVVGPVLEYQSKNPTINVMVLPDHPTPCAVKTHTHEPVPYALYYDGIEIDKQQCYSENEARNGNGREFQFPWELLDYFILQK